MPNNYDVFIKSFLISSYKIHKAHIFLTQLFVENVISMAVLIAGLLVNAGVGLLVLFRTNKNIKENLKIVVILYFIGVISGIILQIF